jgi:glycosyltransferase involved in cell wall biosynthesis
LIDFQDALNSYTGIPLCTRNDTIVLNNCGFRITLWVSGDESKLQVKKWIKDEQRLKQPEQIKILSNRPSNKLLWFTQFLQIRVSLPETDYFYCSLFPGIILPKTTQRMIRMHDPFGSSRNWLKSFLNGDGKLKLRIARALRTKALTKVIRDSMMVFNSQYTLKRCEALYGSLNGSVIYSLVQFSGILKNRDLNANSPYFLIIGGSRQRKKPEIIVNLWSSSDLNKSFDLVVVGKIPSHLLSIESKQLLAAGKLRLVNSIDNAKLRSLIDNCVATVFYSLGEGWGQPLAESVFCGKPIICNDLEVFEEVVNGFAKYFSTNSPNELVPLAHSIYKMHCQGEINESEIVRFGERYGLENLKIKWRDLLA